MNYFDPARPKLANGAPCYVGKDGAPIAALQSLHIDVLEPDEARPEPRVEVSIWLLVEAGAARQFTATCEATELPDLITDWLADPESTLLKVFGYTWLGVQAPTTAADLDL